MTDIPMSAPTTLIIAMSRAALSRLGPAPVRSRATRLYWRTTFADQNFAIVVCSSLRTLLFAAPYALIWLNASTHSPLWSDGGGSGRNWSTLCRMKGRTFPTHGTSGAANGGVRRQTPGPGGSVGKGVLTAIGVIRPSPLRRAMMSFAAWSPTACPSVLACPGGIAERASAWDASRLGRTPRQNAYTAGGEAGLHDSGGK